VRDARQPEGERLAQIRSREHRPDQRREPPANHDRVDRRHDDIGEDNAEDTGMESDDEDQPGDQRAGRPCEHQRDELAGALADAQHLQRNEVEAGDERVDDDERDEQPVVRTVQQVSAHPLRRGDAGDHQRAVHHRQEEEDGAREPLTRPMVGAVEVQPHERGVHAPPEHNLRHCLDGQQHGDDPVVRRRQIARVDRQQQEADERRSDVAEAVDDQVAEEILDARLHDARLEPARDEVVKASTAAAVSGRYSTP
jgi:hypothetical protein